MKAPSTLALCRRISPKAAQRASGGDHRRPTQPPAPQVAQERIHVGHGQIARTHRSTRQTLPELSCPPLILADRARRQIRPYPLTPPPNVAVVGRRRRSGQASLSTAPETRARAWRPGRNELLTSGGQPRDRAAVVDVPSVDPPVEPAEAGPGARVAASSSKPPPASPSHIAAASIVGALRGTMIEIPSALLRQRTADMASQNPRITKQGLKHTGKPRRGSAGRNTPLIMWRTQRVGGPNDRSFPSQRHITECAT